MGPVLDSRRTHSRLRGDRVVATAAVRVTPADPFHREPASGKGSVRANRLQRVSRTTGRKPATAQRAKEGRLRRRDRPAIKPDAEDQDVLQRIHWLLRGGDQTCPVQRRHKITLHLVVALAGDGGSRHQDQIHRPGQFSLMQTERLAQEPLHTAANNSPSNLRPDHHTQPRTGPGGKSQPIHYQGAMRQAPTLIPHTGEVPTVLDPHPAAKAQSLGRFGHENQTGVRRLRPARRRRAIVAAPRLVLLRARKPCCRLRRIFDG